MKQDEILSAKPHHVRRYLNSLGVIDHRHEKFVHYHSERLRKMAKESPMEIVEHDITDPRAEPMRYEFYSDLADQLDSYHQQFHERGIGRIVVFSDDEVIQHALNLAAGTHEARNGCVVKKEQENAGK